jgi:hypothetical protein
VATTFWTYSGFRDGVQVAHDKLATILSLSDFVFQSYNIELTGIADAMFVQTSASDLQVFDSFVSLPSSVIFDSFGVDVSLSNFTHQVGVLVVTLSGSDGDTSTIGLSARQLTFMIGVCSLSADDDVIIEHKVDSFENTTEDVLYSRWNIQDPKKDMWVVTSRDGGNEWLVEIDGVPYPTTDFYLGIQDRPWDNGVAGRHVTTYVFDDGWSVQHLPEYSDYIEPYTLLRKAGILRNIPLWGDTFLQKIGYTPPGGSGNVTSGYPLNLSQITSPVALLTAGHCEDQNTISMSASDLFHQDGWNDSSYFDLSTVTVLSATRTEFFDWFYPHPSYKFAVFNWTPKEEISTIDLSGTNVSQIDWFVNTDPHTFEFVLHNWDAPKEDLCSFAVSAQFNSFDDFWFNDVYLPFLRGSYNSDTVATTFDVHTFYYDFDITVVNFDDCSVDFVVKDFNTFGLGVGYYEHVILADTISTNTSSTEFLAFTTNSNSDHETTANLGLSATILIYDGDAIIVSESASCLFNGVSVEYSFPLFGGNYYLEDASVDFSLNNLRYLDTPVRFVAEDFSVEHVAVSSDYFFGTSRDEEPFVKIHYEQENPVVVSYNSSQLTANWHLSSSDETGGIREAVSVEFQQTELLESGDSMLLSAFNATGSHEFIAPSSNASFVEIVAIGGGGGGSTSAGWMGVGVGSGGGGGAVERKILTFSELSAGAVDVFVGAGGSAGSGAGGANDGQATLFHTVTAYGGKGATTSSNTWESYPDPNRAGASGTPYAGGTILFGGEYGAGGGGSHGPGSNSSPTPLGGIGTTIIVGTSALDVGGGGAGHVSFAGRFGGGGLSQHSGRPGTGGGGAGSANVDNAGSGGSGAVYVTRILATEPLSSSLVDLPLITDVGYFSDGSHLFVTSGTWLSAGQIDSWWRQEYQWQEFVGGVWQDIVGAATNTYSVSSTDAVLRVRVDSFTLLHEFSTFTEPFSASSLSAPVSSTAPSIGTPVIADTAAALLSGTWTNMPLDGSQQVEIIWEVET